MENMDQVAFTEAIKQYGPLPNSMTAMEVYHTLKSLTFAQKLWTVSMLKTNGFMRWSSDGALIMFDLEGLEEYVKSPRSLFTIKSMPLFLSELKRHKFKLIQKTTKDQRGHTLWVYKHELFHRDHKELLLKIVPHPLNARIDYSESTDDSFDTPECSPRTEDEKPPTPDGKHEEPKADLKPSVEPSVETIWPTKENFLRHIIDTSTASYYAEGRIHRQVGQHDPRVFMEKPMDLKRFFEKRTSFRTRYVPPKLDELQDDDSAYTNPQPSTSRQAKRDTESQTP